ncbi:ALQxL family class IV lanthipeptide [Sphaerisporangium viridialbum]
MELDVNALDMLPASEEPQLYPCQVTCPPGGTCGGRTCFITQ